MKWNESGFRPPLCTYRLNWARRTSWGWWDEWDDTVLQKQDSKFKPWRSEAEHATSRSRRLPTILSFTRGWGRNIFCFFQTAETGNRTPDSGVNCWAGGLSLKHCTFLHNTEFHTWMGKKHFCFFQTAETGNRTPDSGVNCWAGGLSLKHCTFLQCWFNVGPASQSLA